MNHHEYGDEYFEQIAARLDRLEHVPNDVLADLVIRDGACSWVGVHSDQPEWTGDDETDRELATQLCAACHLRDECLELEFRTTGYATSGVLGGLAEDDRRAAYLAWLRRREGGRR
jgi:WhiB family redox-sensing transcriptional regulator